MALRMVHPRAELSLAPAAHRARPPRGGLAILSRRLLSGASRVALRLLWRSRGFTVPNRTPLSIGNSANCC